MKKLITIAILATTLAGCAGIMDLLPSNWDPNESAAITDARYSAVKADCANPKIAEDLLKVQQRLDWLVLYTQSKGSKDINKMLTPVKETLDPLVQRAQQGGMSPAYCQLKMKIIRAELDAVARGTNARNMP